MGTTFATTLAPAELIMRHFDPERIQGYCATCPQHGRLWSCPPFGKSLLDYFPSWSHGVLVFQKVWTEAGSTKENMIERFQAVRRRFRDLLLSLENLHTGLTTLVAGHCQVCETCTRPDGKPCVAPGLVRFSLEAVGFDVSCLAEELGGQKILWPAEGLPEYLLMAGAILCPEYEVAVRVELALKSEGPQ